MRGSGDLHPLLRLETLVRAQWPDAVAREFRWGGGSVGMSTISLRAFGPEGPLLTEGVYALEAAHD